MIQPAVGVCVAEPARILIAGGGTGGHLFPAVAIGSALRKYGAEVRYVGSSYGIESRLLPEMGETPCLLDIRGFQRGFQPNALLTNLLLPWRIMKSYLKADRLVRTYKPQVVVGTGGYSSGIPMLAALFHRIKTVIQEQNSVPGLTTRFLARYAHQIYLAFSEANSYLKKNGQVTGNPIRSSIQLIERDQACRQLNLDPDKNVVMLTGGSQGARPLNRHMADTIHFYAENEIQVIWQCGKWDYGELQKIELPPNVQLVKFIDDMGTALSAADVVVSRAGAVAISELLMCGRAMILVPFPGAAADHQTVNARSLADRGAAVLVRQAELETGKLEEKTIELLNDENLRRSLTQNALKLARPDAAEKIAKAVLELV